MASLWKKPKSDIWCVSYRENGRQRVRSLQTRSKREALKLKQAIEVTLDENGSFALEVRHEPSPATTNPTLAEFWDSFEQWAIEHRTTKTIEEYRNWFIQFRDFTRAKRVGDISPKDVEAFKTSLSRQGKGKPKGVGLNNVSINNALRTLNAIWNRAIRLDVYSGENPFSKVEHRPVPRRLDSDYLDRDQVDALLRAAQSYSEMKYVRRVEARNVYLAIGLMALAGLRKREACFSRWDWVNWNLRTLIVNNDEHFTTKNKRPRTISMSAQLIAILKPHAQASGYILEATKPSNSKTEYRADFKNAFCSVCEIAGIQTTPHALRHSFASRHAVAGTSLHVISGWLGHSTLWTTQKYAHYQKTFNEAADNI